VIASNTIFAKNMNVHKTFLVSVVLVYDLLECLTGIPLHVFQLFAGFELNEDSTTPSLPRDKTNIDVAISSSRPDEEFPALRSEEMHEAKEENLVNALETDST
jgi:hypothetical protein